MTKKIASLYICIIIVLCSLFIGTKSAYAMCPSVYYQIFDSFTKAAASLSFEKAREFISTMEQVFGGQLSACDEAGNPIVNPTGDPNAPTPTVDPNATPTPTPDPNAPTPVRGGEEEYADRLVQLANDHCGGIVSSNNENCMDNFSSIMDTNAISVFKDFPHDTKNIDWKGDTDPPYDTMYLQCVSCMRGMPTARGRPYDGRGDAKYHANLSVAGYTYYSNTQANRVYLVPGALFVRTAGTYGHVGYVTKVLYDSNNQVYGMKVFECNWSANGAVKHGRTVLIDSIAGWQKPDSL